IAAGRIRAVNAPAELGGRATAQATVSWLTPDGHQSVHTGTPTRMVAELTSRFGGEIPELTVTRPSLEDVYLAMIGHARDGAAEGLPKRSPATTLGGAPGSKPAERGAAGSEPAERRAAGAERRAAGSGIGTNQ